jgi:hypothetical protein
MMQSSAYYSMSEPRIITLVPTRNFRNDLYESGERLPAIAAAVGQRSPVAQQLRCNATAVETERAGRDAGMIVVGSKAAKHW